MALSSILRFHSPGPGCLSPQGPKIAQTACAEALLPVRLPVRVHPISSGFHGENLNNLNLCFRSRIFKRIAAMSTMLIRTLRWHPRLLCARVLHLQLLETGLSKLLSPEVPAGGTASLHPRGRRLRGLCFKSRTLHPPQLYLGQNPRIVVPPRRQDLTLICGGDRRQ